MNIATNYRFFIACLHTISHKVSIKDECLSRMVIPLRNDQMRHNLTDYSHWYNEHRPHSRLNGATPLEIYANQIPANLRLRYEPRCKWPITSGCAAPIVPIKGKCGVRLKLHVSFIDKNQNLPVIKLRKIA